MWAFLTDAVPPPAVDNTASLYALVGVVLAALLTAVGGIIIAVLGKRRDRDGEAGLDAHPGEIAFITAAYSDCRTDLVESQKRVRLLEAELDEVRSISEYLLREITGAKHVPKTDPLT